MLHRTKGDVTFPQQFICIFPWFRYIAASVLSAYREAL